MTKTIASLWKRPSRHVFAAVVAALAVAQPFSANALIDDVAAAALAVNLDILSAGQNIPVANETALMMADPVATDADWRDFFQIYFETRLFTPQLLDFFVYAVNELPAAAPRPAFVAATAGAAAAGPILAEIAETGRPGDFGSLLYSLNTLQFVLPGLPVERRSSIFALLINDAQGRTLDLRAVVQPGPGGSAPTAMLGMQICMTLSAYATPGYQQATVANMLLLPDRIEVFWRETGVFLFDNGALSDLQVASLNSLIRAFPAGLHEIAALLAADAYGLDATLPGLVTSGQIVPVPLIRIDILTNPAEFIVPGVSPVAPEFTATAGVNIFRAVQAVQFARRPHLALRRDAILARAAMRSVNYMRQTIRPDMYFANPSEFLPMTAYLWIINSEAAWAMSLDLFALRLPPAPESLLLIADILSNGTDSSILFVTSLNGIVTGSATPISRVFIEDIVTPDPAMPFGAAFWANPQVNGIVVGGEFWRFSLGPAGQLLRLFPARGTLAL